MLTRDTKIIYRILQNLFFLLVFSIFSSIYAGVLTIVKSADKYVVDVGETINYCLTLNPQYVLPKADIVWVIDRSGSMCWGIENIRANLQYFTEQLSGRAIDYRLGLLTYVDGMYDSYGFADTDEKFKNWLAAVPCAGGIEQSLEALYEAYYNFPWRQDASRTMILITDEGIPCAEAGGDPLSLYGTATDLFSRGVIIHAITYNPSVYGYDEPGKCNPIFLPPLAGGIWLDYNTPAENWNIFLQILGEAIAKMNNVVIRDPLPPQLMPIPESLNGGVVNDNEIVWTIPEIDRRTTYEICFSAKIIAPFDGEIPNTAYGSANGVPETQSNDIYIILATPTVTMTHTFTYTPTNTPTFTETFTVTNSRTFTPTRTMTITRTFTQTFTATFSITQTITLTNTLTLTNTPTGTPTITETVTHTYTRTFTLTATTTHTPTPTLTMTGTYTITPTYTPTKAIDHFDIDAPASVRAGDAFFITVTAKTKDEEIVEDYEGTVHFTTDALLYQLPSDHKYELSYCGSHIFKVTFYIAGMTAINVNDVILTYVTGSASVLVLPAPAISFTILAPSSVMAGEVFYITVTAKDQYNNIVTDYTGTARFSSTDPQAQPGDELPSDTQFLLSDAGTKILPVVLKTKGIQTITATDIVNTFINGTSNDINVHAGPVVRFQVVAPATVNANVAFNFYVTAKDAYNNTIDNYTGLVTFTSTDPLATLPSDYNFVLSDNGSRVFEATMQTAGIQTITVVQVGAPSVNGTSNNINVIVPATSYNRPLLLTSYLTQPNHYEFCYIRMDDRNFTFNSNYYLEYDVYVPPISANFYCSTEFQNGVYPAPGNNTMRDFAQTTQNYIRDQNGIRVHPSMDISAYAKGKWYHRKFDVSMLAPTGYYADGFLSQDTGNIGYNGAPSNNPGTFNAFFDNIVFTNSSGTIIWDVFSNTYTMKVGAEPYIVMNYIPNNQQTYQTSWKTTTTYPLDNYIWVIDGWKAWVTPANPIVADGVQCATITAYVWTPPVGSNTKVAYALIDFKSERAEDIIEPVTVSLNTYAITDWNGNAYARIKSTKAGPANIKLYFGHFEKIVTVNFIAGSAAKVDISPDYLSLQTGVNGTLNVKITDQYGNFVSDPKMITLTSSSQSMLFSTDNGANWYNYVSFAGTTLKSVLVKDATANTATVSASAASLLPDNSILYINDAPVSYVTIQPQNSITRAGDACRITLQAKDMYGNNTFSNTNVFLSSSSNTMQFSSDSVNWYSTFNTGLNNGTGYLYFRDTKVANNITITAQPSGITVSAKAYATIIPNTPAILDAWADRYSVPAGQSVTITALVTDIYGNAIAGKWVTFTAMVQTGRTQNAYVAPLYGMTDANGRVSTVFTVSTDPQGSMNYCVVNTDGVLGKTVTISTTGGTATRYAFLPNPISTGADKIVLLFINAKDNNGYNCPAGSGHENVHIYANNTNVLFSYDGGINWYKDLTLTVDANGQATCNVKSHYPGTYYLWGRDLNLTPYAPAYTTMTVTEGLFLRVSPTALTYAPAGSTITVEAQIVDQNGNTRNFNGVAIHFTTNNGSVFPTDTYTNVSGKATTVLTLSLISNIEHIITASMVNPDDVSKSAKIITQPVVSFAVIAPANGFMGMPIFITVRAKDTYGNTVSDYTGNIKFGSTDGAAVLPPNYTFTLADFGIKVFPVTFNTYGIHYISVTDTVDSAINGISDAIFINFPPTPTVTPTHTPTATNTITKTFTLTFTFTITKTITPTYTQTITDTITPTVTETATDTVTETITPTITHTPTQTITPSFTLTITQTYTPTETYTITMTLVNTDTATPTETEYLTPTPTYTETDTHTYTVTQTHTYTFTETCTITRTHTPYLSHTVTRTLTASATITMTSTITPTPIPKDIYEYDDTYDYAKVIAPWEVQRHNIVDVGDVDWIKFTLVTTSLVTVETSGDSVDTEMWLYDAAGVPTTHLYYDDDSGVGACSKIQTTLGPGTYYVKIQDYGNNNIIPEYFVSLTVLGPDSYENDNTWTSAKYIYPGLTQIHSIFPANDTDWVKFDVTTNSIVNITLSGETGDTIMYLYNSTGVPNTYIYMNNDIGGFNFFSSITANLTPGTYYVRIIENGMNQVIGSYNIDLTINPATPTATPTPAGPDIYEVDNTYNQAKQILSNSVQEHSIHLSFDVDWVYFTVTNNSVVDIETYGQSGDTAIYLYDSSGVPDTYIAMDNDSGLGYFSKLTVNLSPGTYYVRVIENGQNALIPSYFLKVVINEITPTFTVTPVIGDIYEYDDTFPNAKEITSGATQTHSIYTISDIDWVKFTVNSDAIVNIWTSGGYDDTEIYLYDSLGVPGTFIAYDDNSGVGLFSSITKQLTPGIYYVKINEKGVDQTIAQYDLHLNIIPVTPTVTPTPVVGDAYEYDDDWTSANWIYDGMVQQHSIHINNDTDWVKFTIGEQLTANIITSGSSGEIALWLYDAAGVPVAPVASDGGSARFASITRVLPAGTYYVKVQEYGQDAIVGEYFITLNLSTWTPTVTPTFTVTPTNTVTGDIYEYDNDYLNAKEIYNGIPQTHSIMPAGDYDWVKFTITNQSVVVVQTSGNGTSGNTVLRLYTASGTQSGTAFATDDNSGGYLWSMISVTLNPGTYYARVEGAYNPYTNVSTIDSYQLMLFVTVISTATATRTSFVTATPTYTITNTFTATQYATLTPTNTSTISLNEALDNFALNFTTYGNSLWTGEYDATSFGGDSAQSGLIGNNMQTYIETEIMGPGQISFYWKVSSELNSDIFAFYVDKVKITQISGEVSWQQYVYEISAGIHTLKWEYAKDGSNSAGFDRAWLDNISFVFMTATPTPYFTHTNTQTPTPTGTPTISFAEAVDSPDTVFVFYGANLWSGQKEVYLIDGDAGKSGVISDGQYTYVETLVTGPGSLSFYWKVSSQPNSDYLRLYVDGFIDDSISGEIDWTLKTVNLGDGQHLIRWMYVKDGSGSAGSDCGYIDGFNYIRMTPTITDTYTITNTFTSTRTQTPTLTQTQTRTPTPTITETGTITQTHTNSPYVTATPTYTNTPTSTVTRTATITPTAILWTAGGLWHQVPDGESPSGNPSTSPYCWYYGIDGVRNYDTGARTFGYLTSPVFYNLAPGSVLSFLSWEQTENFPNYDLRQVQISNNGGASWTLLRDLFGTENVWYIVSIDLSTYAGQNVIIRFMFDSVDSVGNNYRGWYVDDIRIISPTPTNTRTVTSTRTNTLTRTQTNTPTNTQTPTQTRTLTLTVTKTHTGTETQTATLTFTNTQTFTPSFTFTSTATITPTEVVVGLWHLVSDSSVPEGNNSASPYCWYYGIDATLTYNTGARTYGNLITQIYYNLPQNMFLSFMSWEETENSTDWDVRNVYVSTNAGDSWTLLRKLYGIENQWYKVVIDMSDYAGQDVMFRFEFDSVDDYDNDHRGWYVDDIEITGNTPTMTITPTLTYSETITYTETETLTMTLSATSTETAILIPSATFTATGTIDVSWTASETPTITETITGTPPTATSTPTITETTILIPSATFTATGTIDVLWTASETPTITQTITGTPSTATSTPTITETTILIPSATFTATGTIDVMWTASETPTITETITGTPPTATSTPTITETTTLIPSATFTATGTIDVSWTASETPTITETITWTPSTTTSTPTITETLAVPSYTNTETQTTTSSHTPTITETETNTPSITPSNTRTLVPTRTFSQTRTSTCTNTPTITETNTMTMTETMTFTFTPTSTYTATATSTQTFTRTYTLTNTATPSFTNTRTITETSTHTFTRTSTPTFTFTFTFTPTPTSTTTFTLTFTRTYTTTFTDTPTITETSTVTLTLTITQTYTITPTHTISDTYTTTLTFTNTFTPSPTFTITNSFTDTPTYTYTMTDTITPSITQTTTMIFTYTPTAGPTTGEFDITDIIIYPNPVNPGYSKEINIKFISTQNFSKIKMVIFTTSFRKVKEINLLDNYIAGINTAKINTKYFKNMSNGIYYYYIIFENQNGMKVRSKAEEMVIMR